MTTELYFLGAGKPVSGNKPAALKILFNTTRALDWQLNSFSGIIDEENIHFLGGYHIEDIVELYPTLSFTIIPDWQSKNALDTLLHAPLTGESAFFTYSDTLFRKEFIESLPISAADVIVVVDKSWKKRYVNRSVEDISNAETITALNAVVEFTGLIYVNEKSLNILRKSIIRDSPELVGNSFKDIVEFFDRSSADIRYIDVGSDWAEFNSASDITNFILGTKADTLSRLENLVKKSHIGVQERFTSNEWTKNHVKLTSQIQSTFGDTKLVVRSSSKAEDNWQSSNAGGFESVLDVPSLDKEQLYLAIQRVVDSYGDTNDGDNQILVQKFLQDVSMAGVVFTCSLETGAPYYRFNFDDSSKSTDSVTAGLQANLRTIIISKSNSESIVDVAPELKNVLLAVQELEELLNLDKLDIEFAVDSKGQVHTFQARPIVVNHDSYDIDRELINESLKNDINRYHSVQRKFPQIYGDRTLFANMPDWNPAEIVGIKPKPLAFSLYQELISNHIWAQQRAEFGYKDVRPFPLILSFSGQPYVDVRASFNSFIPKSLPKDSSARIVNAYIDILNDNREFHDKVEFEVAFTVWVPGFKNIAEKRLLPYGVHLKDILLLEEGLKEITRHAFSRLAADIESVGTLAEKRLSVIDSELSPIDKAYSLLEDCKNFGTLAFSHAARAGFVAKVLMESLVNSGEIDKCRYVAFMKSFATVAGQFESDKILCSKDELTKDNLILNYGHLRPGTYEISIPAYWEDPEQYFPEQKIHSQQNSSDQFSFLPAELDAISSLLEELGVTTTALEFIDYTVFATQKRESVKFEFTRNLSKALDCLSDYGHQNKILREDMSFMTYSDLEALRLNMINVSMLKKNITLNKRKYEITSIVELPSLISSASDFWCFERHSMLPNFVGVDSVTAAVVNIEHSKADLMGKIVLIRQADPGFDWLFGHDIAGLITQYGGANSHMAIRAAELGLPAAIGVGEKLYESLLSVSRLELDCLGQRIRVIV